MTEKRFQVFISSTFRDLEEERREVMQALLELDCMPAGMELFPAANESQWSLIKRVIDDCDYYLLILAGRYGSIRPEGIGYTEMEYRYALSVGKPIISFVHRNPGKIIAEKSESSDDGKAKLTAFRSSVEKRLCKQWDTPQELGSVVSRSLVQLIKSTPAIGWVRANELADREATIELLQLRRKVEELQKELDHVRTSAPQGAKGLAQGSDTHVFRFSFKARAPGEYTYSGYSSEFTASWDALFSVIAPLMIAEAKEDKIKDAVDSFIARREYKRIINSENLKEHRLEYFSLNTEDFQTLKVQFRALGLIAKSEKNRSVKDTETYWTLTPYGDEVMTQLRAIRRLNETSAAFETVGEDIPS